MSVRRVKKCSFSWLGVRGFTFVEIVPPLLISTGVGGAGKEEGPTQPVFLNAFKSNFKILSAFIPFAEYLPWLFNLPLFLPHVLLSLQQC